MRRADLSHILAAQRAVEDTRQPSVYELPFLGQAQSASGGRRFDPLPLSTLGPAQPSYAGPLNSATRVAPMDGAIIQEVAGVYMGVIETPWNRRA